MGKLRIVILAALVILYAVLGAPAFFQEDGHGLLRALSYSFFHASWWHLAVNCVAVWGMFAPKVRVSPGQMLAAYLIAVAVYPLSFRPVIGFSNVLYALIGLRTPPFSSPWWKRPEVILFLALTLLMLFVPRFSATTHIAAFALGTFAAGAARWFKQIGKDAGRYA